MCVCVCVCGCFERRADQSLVVVEDECSLELTRCWVYFDGCAHTSHYSGTVNGGGGWSVVLLLGFNGRRKLLLLLALLGRKRNKAKAAGSEFAAGLFAWAVR